MKVALLKNGKQQLKFKIVEKDTKVTFLVFGTVVVLAIGGILIFRSLNKGKVEFPKDSIWAQEKGAVSEVERLHPKLRKKFSDFFNDVEKLGYSVFITDAHRTATEQAGLNFQNSSNADVGLSDHEYGFAVDINIKKDGKIVLRKANSKQDWIKSGVVDIAKKHGFKWGGDFNNYHDPVHFYNDFGIPSPEMKKRLLAGEIDKEGYLKV